MPFNQAAKHSTKDIPHGVWETSLMDSFFSLRSGPPLTRRGRFWLTTNHGVNIPAFFIDRQSNCTILFSHGNAQDLGMIYDWFKSFSAVLQVNVMAYDYTGYGKCREVRGEVADCDLALGA